MKRYYPRLYKSGFPDLYVVVEACSSSEHYPISDPKPYHEANDEAAMRNNGTWEFHDLGKALYGWAVQIPDAP